MPTVSSSIPTHLSAASPGPEYPPCGTSWEGCTTTISPSTIPRLSFECKGPWFYEQIAVATTSPYTGHWSVGKQRTNYSPLGKFLQQRDSPFARHWGPQGGHEWHDGSTRCTHMCRELLRRWTNIDEFRSVAAFVYNSDSRLIPVPNPRWNLRFRLRRCLGVLPECSAACFPAFVASWRFGRVCNKRARVPQTAEKFRHRQR